MFDLEQFCTNHPHRAAIEKCEVCGKPLCGYCLYYSQDGKRLCEEHAKLAESSGDKIYPPAAYADGINLAQVDATRNVEQYAEEELNQLFKPRKNENPVLYRGNNADLNAFVAMLLGIFGVMSCCGAYICFPFMAVLMAVFALLNASDSVDPNRTRQQAIIALLTGGGISAGIVMCIGGYILLFSVAAATPTTFITTPYIFPTSTITPIPTNTPQIGEPFDADKQEETTGGGVMPSLPTPERTPTPPIFNPQDGGNVFDIRLTS